MKLHTLTLAILAALPLAAQTPVPAANADAIKDFQVYRGTQVTPEVERIYEKGLRYLMRAQNDDGSFPGQYGTEPGVVGFALMALLSHGDDPNHGPYAKAVKKCLEFLLKNQGENGYIGSSMYNHGFATLGLAEAYGSLQDERLGPALKKAVELILSSQDKNQFKAWRYSPEATDADSTVSGACFVALIAARNAGLKVPEKNIEGALKFMADCQSPTDGSIGYMPRSGSHGGATTAIGVAMYAYARKKDSPTYVKALKKMKLDAEEGGGSGSYPFYLEYYAAQAFFQSDLKGWQDWNDRQVQRLTESQNEDGSWDAGLGPGTSTALGLLSIALNYRYLPIYER